MQNNLLAAVYGKSLLGIAREHDVLEQVHTDVLYLLDVCRQSSEFRNIINSPIIAPHKKWKILNAVTQGKISDLSVSFMKLLIRKDREKNLVKILESFVQQYNEVMGIHEVRLTTAQELSAEARQAFLERIQTQTNFPTIHLETVVNPNLIGGFVLEYHDYLVDASIRRDLKDIKKQFKTNLYEHNIR